MFPVLDKKCVLQGGGLTGTHTRIRMDLLDSDEVGSELILEILITDELTVYEHSQSD
jgi:hypothetical protein